MRQLSLLIRVDQGSEMELTLSFIDITSICLGLHHFQHGLDSKACWIGCGMRPGDKAANSQNMPRLIRSCE